MTVCTTSSAGVESAAFDLALPHVIAQDLARGYAEMAADEARERQADAWSEGLIADVADEPRRRSH